MMGLDQLMGQGVAEFAAEDTCAKESLNLVNPGQLTIGTDNPAFPPWFEGGTPIGVISTSTAAISSSASLVALNPPVSTSTTPTVPRPGPSVARPLDRLAHRTVPKSPAIVP